MSSDDESVVEGINGFLADPETLAHADWTVPPLGSGPLLPALLGLLFTSLVAWDFVSSRVRPGTTARASGPRSGVDGS